jgi:hypothetical protein
VGDAVVESPAYEEDEKRKKHRVSKPSIPVTVKEAEPTWLEKLINSGTNLANAAERGASKTADDAAHVVAEVPDKVADAATGIAEDTKTAAEAATSKVLGFPEWAVNLGTEANNALEKNVSGAATGAADTVRTTSSSFFGGIGGFFSPRTDDKEKEPAPAEPGDTFVGAGAVQEEGRKKIKKKVVQSAGDDDGAPRDDRV